MCILLNVKKHEKTFALNVDIFRNVIPIKFIMQMAVGHVMIFKI